MMIPVERKTKPLPLSGRRRWVVVGGKVGPSVQKTLTDSPDEGDDETIMIVKENDDYDDSNKDTMQ